MISPHAFAEDAVTGFEIAHERIAVIPEAAAPSSTRAATTRKRGGVAAAGDVAATLAGSACQPSAVPSPDRQHFYAALAELAHRYSDCAPPPAAALTGCELGVYSQNGEDGVIAEILRRVGLGRREFVEFGIESGVEGNCVLLADVLGWRGTFIEADDAKFESLSWKYRDLPAVRTVQARVTAENINELFAANRISGEPDIVSIDVDGNDLWIWRALTRARPRVVVIEYNARLEHDRPLVQPYDPDWVWQGTDWFGASIGALEAVARDKSYQLVHTELTGVNAFFVRSDLMHAFSDITWVPRRSQNYFGTGHGHPPHPGGGTYVELVSGSDH